MSEERRPRLTDEDKLAMAEERARDREMRRREKEERQARGVDYEDIVPMAAEERAERQPNVADIAATAAASVSGGGNTAEIAAAVAAAVAQVMLAQQQPAPWTTGPRPVAPAILKRRETARIKMEELIDEVQRADQWPLYELLTDFYYGEQLHPATITRKGPYGSSEVRNRIRFQEIPNEGMVPKDELAKRIHGLFLEWIGGETPDLGDIVHDAMRHRPRHAVTDGIPEPRLMGKEVDPSTVRLRVMTDTPEEEVTYVGAPKVLGTVQAEVPGLY